MKHLKLLTGIGVALSVMLGGGAFAQDKPIIAVMPKTVINDTFMNNLANFAKAKGEELGAVVEIHSVSGHGAIEEQVSAIEAAISKGVKGIVLAALDSKGLVPALNRAAEAGVHVVLADSGVESDKYITVVRTDNVRASGLAADYAAALLSYKGKVAQLEGEPGAESAIDRVKGFHEGIAKYPDIELVASLTGHWTTPGGVETTEAILASHPDVNLIFASSDLMAVGAAEVLKRQNRTDVIIVGFDGIPEGIELVRNGQSAGDVAQSAQAMGEISVSILMDVISGKKAAGDFEKTMDSGMQLVHPWNVDKYRKEVLGQTE